MKIDLEFVELHSPLFLGGVNFGLKLYPNSKGGLEMWYDTDLEHTIVVYKGKVAMLETTASMTLKDPKQLGLDIAPPAKPGLATLKDVFPQAAVKAQVTGPERTIRTAQVSTPHDNVQGKPGRKAKFQGEESPTE